MIWIIRVLKLSTRLTPVNSGFPHRGDHQRVGQTDGHAERLLCDQRQQQGNELLPGEQRRLMERGRFGLLS